SARITARKAWASMARVDPARPRGEAAELVLVQSGQALSGLEGLLHPPSRPGDADQCGQGRRGRRPAAVVGEFTGGAVAADQQPVTAWPGLGQVDDGPIVEAVPLGAGEFTEAMLTLG